MKKIMLVALLVISVAFTSCKKDKKEEVKTEHKKGDKNAAHKSKKMAVLYQCPMDCEKGKSYTKQGSCPVCKMDLKAKKVGEKLEEATKEVLKKVNDQTGHSH